MPRTLKGVKTKPKKKFHGKKRPCLFTAQGIEYIDYKDVAVLEKFVSKSTGKILPRGLTGTSSKMQRKLAKAIKQSREVGYLPFVK